MLILTGTSSEADATRPMMGGGRSAARGTAGDHVELGDAEFAAIARLAYGQVGIVLGANKRNLVYGRLVRRVRALGLRNFGDYCAYVTAPEGAAERRAMINALTTNVTHFFRERHHFDFLGDTMLPALLDGTGNKRIRLWSAGCSSGEEPYSMAMTMLDVLQRSSRTAVDAKILATDVDTDIIALAQIGRYEADRGRSIPPAFRARYTEVEPDGSMTMGARLRAAIVFKPLNIFDAWPMRGKFDAIFCRNVIIYFSKDDQLALLNAFADILTLGGCLFLGHSETVMAGCHRLLAVGRTIYRKVEE